MMMKRSFLWGLLIAITASAVFLFFRAEQKPKVLTTNIDTIHETIIEDGTSGPDDNNGTLLALAGDTADNVSLILRDSSTMLVAAVNPSVKFIKVAPGMRKEEIADILGRKLSWDAAEKDRFLNVNKTLKLDSAEGYYYPDVYALPKGGTGYEVGRIMINRFNDEVMSIYASSTKKIVSVDTAMKIASIIEREAGSKSDMRLISGIMWNRLFKDMTLDIDATLQYAKGSAEEGWWPKVESEDKFIDSPYNTYQKKGLTPTPISNPQLASIQAALNPKKTSCFFYLHDKYRRIHCSATYKEHVRNIEKYYGKS